MVIQQQQGTYQGQQQGHRGNYMQQGQGQQPQANFSQQGNHQYSQGQNQHYQPQQQQGGQQSNQNEGEKIYEDHRVYKVNANSVFLEVVKYGLDIGKVILHFAKYNDKLQKGSRITEEIKIYIDIPEFLQIAQDVKSGRIAQQAKDAKVEAQNKNSHYISDIYKLMGGTSAERLQQQGKARQDGKPLSRQFKIIPGSKHDWVLSAEEGPGESIGTGIIAPRYVKGKAEKKIIVPMTSDSLKQLVLMTEMYIQGYITAKFLKE